MDLRCIVKCISFILHQKKKKRENIQQILLHLRFLSFQTPSYKELINTYGNINASSWYHSKLKKAYVQFVANILYEVGFTIKYIIGLIRFILTDFFFQKLFLVGLIYYNFWKKNPQTPNILKMEKIKTSSFFFPSKIELWE